MLVTGAQKDSTRHDHAEVGAFLAMKPSPAGIFPEVINAVRTLADREIVPRNLGDFSVDGLFLFDDPSFDASDLFCFVKHGDG